MCDKCNHKLIDENPNDENPDEDDTKYYITFSCCKSKICIKCFFSTTKNNCFFCNSSFINKVNVVKLSLDDYYEKFKLEILKHIQIKVDKKAKKTNNASNVINFTMRQIVLNQKNIFVLGDKRFINDYFIEIYNNYLNTNNIYNKEFINYAKSIVKENFIIFP